MSSTKVMGRRVAAYIVDGLILWGIGLALFFAMAEKDTDVAEKVLSGEYSPDDSTYGNITVGDTEWSIVGGDFLLYLAILFAIGFLYSVVLQGLTGWTLGKLITGLRTVKEDGTAPGVGKAAVRWLLWIADGFPYFFAFGLVGFIVALTNDLRQRVGDKVAGTYVIKASAAGQPVAATAGAPAMAPPQPGFAPPQPGFAPPQQGFAPPQPEAPQPGAPPPPPPAQP